jgi:hypothetical protein
VLFKEDEPDGIALPAGDDRAHRRLRRPEETDPDEAVPDGPDARAAARVQPDLHRVRPIREYESTIKQKLSIAECLDAVDECGAPVVSICGGEPMIYPGIGELVAKILERKKSVYLCTNGMFIRKKLKDFRPSNRFFFNVHLDGMRQTHDLAVEREGVFDAAVDGIRAAKEAGFLVCTNTTVFRRPRWPSWRRCSPS